MRNRHSLQDYEPIKPATSRRFASIESDGEAMKVRPLRRPQERIAVEATSTFAIPNREQDKQIHVSATGFLKRGHSLAYVGLFTFSLLVFFRPYELFSSLSWMSRGALVVALMTLAVFIPTQLGLENRITVRLREVKLAFLLVLFGLLSVPLALEPARAFQSFLEYFKVIVIFIVTVNVVRTEKRLRNLIQLVLVASCVLAIAAVADYVSGNLALQGRRIAGLIGGLFSNPNDLALHLVTMIPICMALFLGSRKPLKRSIYFVCSLLLVSGLVATFSRGGFLGFICMISFLTWKLARRNRMLIGAVVVILFLAAVALAPGAYRDRLSTTDDDSALARTDDLKRSLLVAARHPLFGVGMDNYILYSNTNKATHNAYTQVASEMGAFALLTYLVFLFSPFKRLRAVQASTQDQKRKPSAYYLAIGLQASLVGYMVVSFFASVAYLWYAYYLVGYAVCLARIHGATEQLTVTEPGYSPFTNTPVVVGELD
jgi:putative inorganic carbon (HCO3(-)) transporter